MAVQPNVVTAPPSTDPTVELSIEFLELLFQGCTHRNFQVRFWNGVTWRAGSANDFTLVLKHPGALRGMLAASELALGELYIFDDIDIEGDIESCFRVADFLLASPRRGLQDQLRLGALFSKLPKTGRPHATVRRPELKGLAHAPRRDRQAISYHYDLAPDFYALFLDSRMVYSSGYFLNETDTLDQAQEQKLDYICRKLRLRPGESFLDIGCGWGALITFAAKNYGVRSTGITLSQNQADFARRLIQAEGLQESCRVKLCDYREFDASGPFDKIASIGMFEHVGRRQLRKYFERMSGLLHPDGVFLNSGIASCATDRRRGASFIDKYVFPDGDLVSISTALEAAELSGLEVRDVECLRYHYAETLHHWVKRLEANCTKVRRLADEVTYRIWRLYMAGSAHGFRTGRINLYQTLLSRQKPDETRRPQTREDWYKPQLARSRPHTGRLANRAVPVSDCPLSNS